MVSSKQMGRKKLDRERINITLPKGMPDALAEAAAERGWDRSRLVEELASAYLKKREKEKGQPKGAGDTTDD
jgi:metal-responsive CopG/Arc/MetJ family transcriptional regulator